MGDLLIKDTKGKKIPLTVSQAEDAIILSKKNDKSPDPLKRRVKVYLVDKNKLEAFQQVEVSMEEEKKNLGDFLFQIIYAIRNLVKLRENQEVIEANQNGG